MATVAWTTEDAVRRALGDGALTDPFLSDCVAAANAWAFRRRQNAGYHDPEGTDQMPAPAPSPDVAMGATMYAVALWRERASVDSFASFSDLSSFTPPGGSLGQIRRLLGIGRAAVDGVSDAHVADYRRRRQGRRR